MRRRFFSNHVGNLVRDHERHTLLVCDARRLLVNQQIDLAEGHAAPVLHGAGGKVGNRKQVELLERIVHVEEVLARQHPPKDERRRRRSREDRPPARSGPTRSFRGACSWNETPPTDPPVHLNAVLAVGADHVELAHDEGDEVRGHDGRLVELEELREMERGVRTFFFTPWSSTVIFFTTGMLDTAV